MSVDDALLHLSRRDRLIAAAGEIFARAGFHGATVQQIAEAAGVSTGYLYRHFPGKTALARAIVEQDRVRTRSEIQKLTDATLDPGLAVQLLIERLAEAAAAAPADCRLLAEIAAEAGRDPDIADTVIAADDVVMTLTADLLRQAGFGSAETLAVVIWSALDGLALRVAVAPHFDPRPVAAELVRLLEPSGRTRADPSAVDTEHGGTA